MPDTPEDSPNVNRAADSFNWAAYKRQRPAIIRLIDHFQTQPPMDPKPNDPPPCPQSDRDFDDEP